MAADAEGFSGFAGDGEGIVGVGGVFVRGSDDKDYGREDDRRGYDGAQGDGFACEQPAEKEGDDRVHEGVGAYAGGGAVLEDIEIGGGAHGRAKDDQIGEGHPGARGNGGKMQRADFSGEEAGDPQRDPARQALHGDAKHRRPRQHTML